MTCRFSPEQRPSTNADCVQHLRSQPQSPHFLHNSIALRSVLTWGCIVTALSLSTGCGSSIPDVQTSSESTGDTSKSSKPANNKSPSEVSGNAARRNASPNQPVTSADGGIEKPAKKPSKYAPLDLSQTPSLAETNAPTPTAGNALSDEERQTMCVVTGLQPFQILLGEWRWTTQRKFAGQSRTGNLDWLWDFRADRKQPALVFDAKNHPYFESGRLTYLPVSGQYQMVTKSGDDTRVFEGTWVAGAEPQEVADGKKMHRTYKLEMLQTSPETDEQYRLILTQVDNHDFRMELTRRPSPGSHFTPVDVVRQQRVGTSFAVADSDNPGPKCIVSGGLGTMTVTYEGRSYPVCCSGCAAAFNEDPKRWLAKNRSDGDNPSTDAEKMQEPDDTAETPADQ